MAFTPGKFLISPARLVHSWRKNQRRRSAHERAEAKPLEDHPFWNEPLDALFLRLNSSAEGLTTNEAAVRGRFAQSHSLHPTTSTSWVHLLLSQFTTPIILILLFAAGLSFFLGEAVDSAIIVAIIAVSGLLSFFQEKGATYAMQQLLNLVQVKAAAVRDGVVSEFPVDQIVPGDVVVLNAGDLVPGDGQLLEARDLLIDEASLTGETFPVEKSPGLVAAAAPLRQRRNSLFMGSHVVSGTGRFVVVLTGKTTEFGQISQTLKSHPAATEFEHGVRRFGYLLLELTLLLAIGIFALNAYFGRPILDSLLFTLALSVGLTPQLLPAIISVNLARGAKRMAAQHVIVKRLVAIENFGSMSLLCSDKTGTLTEGCPQLSDTVDHLGQPSAKALLYAALNARLQTGYVNPMDAAIVASQPALTDTWRKIDEVPYDFSRRRLSVLVANGDQTLVITKGALESITEICSRVEASDGVVSDMAEVRASITALADRFSERGLRVLGVAYRRLVAETHLGKDQEREMTFLGLLAFADPLRLGITQTLQELRSLGIKMKIITGDHHLVALDVSRRAGFAHPSLLVGSELQRMSPEALVRRVRDVDVFAEVEPHQKERIVLALRKRGDVVGYIGDGINDASALHAADVGISVATAADVAKEAADIVLLQKDLAVLAQGVREGRVTFANTLKYVFMATSANFGNMFSMAGASLFLPFLPLLPKQILLLNLLTDLPEMTIASDAVDAEWTNRPRRWNLKLIRRFMLTFGLISSLFDYATFALLWFLWRMTPPEFRSGWLIESLLSASFIVMALRTSRPLWRSRPSRPLLVATLVVAAIGLALPYTALAPLLGLAPLSAPVILTLFAIIALYLAVVELTKSIFYRLVDFA